MNGEFFYLIVRNKGEVSRILQTDNMHVTYTFSDREKYGRNLLRCGSFILFY